MLNLDHYPIFITKQWIQRFKI